MVDAGTRVVVERLREAYRSLEGLCLQTHEYRLFGGETRANPLLPEQRVEWLECKATASDAADAFASELSSQFEILEQSVPGLWSSTAVQDWLQAIKSEIQSDSYINLDLATAIGQLNRMYELLRQAWFQVQALSLASQRGGERSRRRNPVVFFSYSWDSEKHREWVLRLAAGLIRNGIEVIIDEWDLRRYDDDLHLFMEQGIKLADYVVIICTPQYARKADRRIRGVGVEASIITSEYFETARPKYILVLRGPAPDARTCIPTFARGRLYLDFRDDAEYERRFEELVRKILGVPRLRRPPLGPLPNLTSRPI